ncbi:heme-dependent oxidative N-demethylase family protein [Parasedimentitalea huanghaiensis]|uniref:DUF3445 domain-containing protein n=1 Tax=Parasedimentitalea huanghaiensis TaxID=2682100 RepID=A0A6L6WC95_9RHOB|nr:DUF3445 domain-containing protein [Zongyanglinia huanghaiensis]MVO14841.1 DUF3445 domain-containing protein [Zongyanglinia huanghaiensis]
MTTILQTQIPYNPLSSKALPGIQPLAPQDWLLPDDAFSAQMKERDRLLAHHRDQVLMLDEQAMPAAQELLHLVLEHLYPQHRGDQLQRLDESGIELDWEDPLGTLGRITQQDFCILEKQGDEHVMTGAVLCFPASWTLSEKYLKPLIGIHQTVAEYDVGIGKRVQRLFDGVQVGRPLWRFNSLWYHDPSLFQPRSQHQPRDKVDEAEAGYMRSEKQMILRLPESRAVVFCIHTHVLTRANVFAQWAKQ